MRLLEVKGEAAIEMLADIIDPIMEIMNDETFKNQIRSDVPKIEVAKTLIKSHSKSILEIMAIANDVPVEDYNPNIFELPNMLMDLLNSEEFTALFTSEVPSEKGESSGNVMENTKEQEPQKTSSGTSKRK